MAWEENSCISLNMQLIAILSRIGVLIERSKACKRLKISLQVLLPHQNLSLIHHYTITNPSLLFLLFFLWGFLNWEWHLKLQFPNGCKLRFIRDLEWYIWCIVWIERKTGWKSCHLLDFLLLPYWIIIGSSNIWSDTWYCGIGLTWRAGLKTDFLFGPNGWQTNITPNSGRT